MIDLFAVARPALFLLGPEQAHWLTIAALKCGLGPRSRPDDAILRTNLCGLDLPNPIGLAAGFDKNAETPAAMLRAGFGFVEIGSVTPRPQPGNPRPRIFRLAQDRAVINRLGFNNEGMEAAAGRLAKLANRQGPIGVNIGANKDSENRIADYAEGYRRLAPLGDYVTVNVSSPNTPGLRDLQTGDALTGLLASLNEAKNSLGGEAPPLFLKVAPDLAFEDCEVIARIALEQHIDGLIVGNTTLSRPATLASANRGEAGGLSGAPLYDLSTKVLADFYRLTQGRLALIGVGGVESGEDAYRKIRAGASAVQLYTALVYGGPGLIGRIKRGLADCLRSDGFGSVADAVGAG